MKRNNCGHKERKRKGGEQEKEHGGDRQSALVGGRVQLERDAQCSAKYAYLFSMPLMGHISLGILCLLPNYKRYSALQLQEICCNKDNIGIWSLC